MRAYVYMSTSVLLKNTPLLKFMRKKISLVMISMISLTSSLAIELYLNSLVHDQNIFGSSSKVFGHFRKMFGKVRVTFGQVLANLRKVVGNLWKIVKNAVNSVSI